MTLSEFQQLTNIYYLSSLRNKAKEYLINNNLDPQKRTITFSAPSETGTSHFRLLEPAFAIMRNCFSEFNILYTEQIQPAHFEISHLIVLHRADQRHSYYNQIANFWPKTKRRPLIIHDVDDNEFQLPQSHPMREMWYAYKKDAHSIFSLSHSDYVTTTGKGLEQVFKKLNKNVHILPNMFNWRLPQWNKEQKQLDKNKIVIGYAGLSSHMEDLKKLIKIWKIIHDQYPQTHFIVSGIVKIDINFSMQKDAAGNIQAKEEPITDPTKTYRYAVEQLFKQAGFDPNRYELQYSKDLHDYGEFYQQYDINCTFIEHNKFNSCKSAIKLIEGLHYSSIPVFSDFGPYRELSLQVPELQQFAVKTESEKEWVNKLSYCIENIEQLQDTVQTIKTKTDDMFDIDKNIEKRVNWYKEILDKHEENEISKVTKAMKLGKI